MLSCRLHTTHQLLQRSLRYSTAVVESGGEAAGGSTTIESHANLQGAQGEKIPLLSFEELFFLHNTSLPSLKQRTFRGRVVASNKRSVYVDIGLHRLVRFPPHELKRR